MPIKALVLHRVREPQAVEEVEVEEPRAGEVLVRVVASGVCHSCLHAAEGSWDTTHTPAILGDEGTGVVERVGPGVAAGSSGRPTARPAPRPTSPAWSPSTWRAGCSWTNCSPGSTRSTRPMKRSATWPRASSPGA